VGWVFAREVRTAEVVVIPATKSQDRNRPGLIK